MTQPALSIVATADDVSAAAGAFIAETLAAAIRERGAAHWCTTGGSSAPGLYRALRAAPLRDGVDWSRVHTWWGDDRFVPAGDPLSNVTPFNDVLREPGAGVAIPDANVHPVPVAEAMAGGGGPEGAAAAYEAELRSRGPVAGMLRPAARRDHPLLGVPAFDLVILGVGPDGHILSVFPGSFVFDQPGWVAAVPAPTHVEPHVPRVTMHPSLVMAARSVLVVTAGASKAEVLAQAWAGGDPRELPLRTTLAANATWLVDEAAARLLKA
ncbi:MAG TPA: 6-phosphogluconolactonase [Candidatus Limnocylindrales bacterium]